MKHPDDETIPSHGQLCQAGRLPKSMKTGPILRSMRAGDFFVTSGEVLFRNYGVEGRFAPHVHREVDTRFRWSSWSWCGNGIRPTAGHCGHEFALLSSHRFRVPFDASGRNGCASPSGLGCNGGFTQPVSLR